MAPPHPDRSLAAVDLGSNSFHMIVARLRDGEPHVVDRLRDRVALAGGLDEQRRFTDEALSRALACLERFGQRLAGLAAGDVRAVGTSAVRQARNGEAFLAAAERALGHRIEVISGAEEARLVYLGVAHGLAQDEGRRLVVDIGGGSTECILGDRIEPLEGHSLHMGCVGWSRRFFPRGRVTAKAFERARVEARVELQELEAPFRERGWESAVGSSGTILAVDAILRESGWSRRGVTAKGLRKLEKALVQDGDVHTVDLPGLSHDRRPVLPGGVAILRAVFEAFRLERMVASSFALREGLLYDLLGRIRHEDVRDRTVRRLAEQYRLDRRHTARVEETALRCFDDVAERWRLDAEARRFLAWAAALHEIGLAVAHSGHHRHGAYLVANAVLPGFSRRSQGLLSALVLSHRRKLSPERIAALVPPDLERTALRLSALLRIAVSLHRSRSAERPAVTARARKAALELAFGPGWLEERPLTHADLQHEAERLAQAGLELTFGD